MLEVSQLSRSYDSFKAVDNVSFTIGKGEIVGLLGHNGAGKTTIMKMISGYLEPNQGKIHVDGINLAENPKSIQMNLGYLPEILPVYPEMTVADYLDYTAALKGLNKNDKITEIKRVIRATDISAKLLAPISTLSSGYKQRVAVAQAIQGRPSLLILDEPTNGLDPDQTQQMRDLICDIAQNATVILSTHIMQEVEAICSRVLMLSTGALVVDARLEELKQSNHLILESSLPESSMEKINSLESVDSISLITTSAEANDSSVYRIVFSKGADGKAVSAEVANAIFQLDHKLYRLLPEHRDLETLFKEVNEERYRQEGMSNAA